MGFRINIKGKRGFFRKPTVDIMQIVEKHGFKYGSYNNSYVLVDEEIHNSSFRMYNPKRIGRGIVIDFKELEKNSQVSLFINLPTTKTEIEEFYMFSKEIIDGLGKVTLYNEERNFTMEEFFKHKDSLIQYSIEEVQKTGTLGKEKILHTSLAKYPYCPTAEEREKFATDEGLDYFEQVIHDAQNRESYYPNPDIYQDKNKNINTLIYTLPNKFESIFPTDGRTTLAAIDTTIDVVLIDFLIYEETRLLDGVYSYEGFMEIIKQRQYEYFDQIHIIIPGFTKEELEEIAKELEENGYRIV